MKTSFSASPSTLGSSGGRPVKVERYIGFRRMVMAVTWKTGNGSTAL